MTLSKQGLLPSTARRTKLRFCDSILLVFLASAPRLCWCTFNLCRCGLETELCSCACLKNVLRVGFSSHKRLFGLCAAICLVKYLQHTYLFQNIVACLNYILVFFMDFCLHSLLFNGIVLRTALSSCLC